MKEVIAAAAATVESGIASLMPSLDLARAIEGEHDEDGIKPPNGLCQACAGCQNGPEKKAKQKGRLRAMKSLAVPSTPFAWIAMGVIAQPR